HVTRILALGLPTRRTVIEGLSECRVPKVFIQSTNDEYGPRQELEAFLAGVAEPKRTEWVEAADHFFSDALDELEDRVLSLWSQLAKLPMDPPRCP
ncbi:MAG: hypothetical protein ACRD96_28590, partial [Bryobacteraceae bacterium]